MFYKISITLFALFLYLFAFTVVMETPVLASSFGERLTKCNNKKEVKIKCYQKLVSDISNRLKKECDSQYKNLTTKLKGHKRARNFTTKKLGFKKPTNNSIIMRKLVTASKLSSQKNFLYPNF